LFGLFIDWFDLLIECVYLEWLISWIDFICLNFFKLWKWVSLWKLLSILKYIWILSDLIVWINSLDSGLIWLGFCFRFSNMTIDFQNGMYNYTLNGIESELDQINSSSNDFKYSWIYSDCSHSYRFCFSLPCTMIEANNVNRSCRQNDFLQNFSFCFWWLLWTKWFLVKLKLIFS
jgi:hypothetical protein